MIFNLKDVARHLFREKARRPSLKWVTGDIAISAAPAADEWKHVAAAGIKAVLEVRKEQGDAVHLERLGLAHWWLPLAEGQAPGQQELLAATDWVIERIRDNERVLIHCQDGRGRSHLVATVCLVRLGFDQKAATSSCGDSRAAIGRALRFAVSRAELFRSTESA